MHARSALFDLYGDHLRPRGGQAPVAALVRLLAPLGVTSPAVRTAISRMVRQGWLRPVRLESGPGYGLTGQAKVRLDDAAARIYRTRRTGWSGSWDLLVLQPSASRSARDRIRSGLGFLGYAPLTDSTWISPYHSTEAESLLADESVEHARFAAADDDPRVRAALAWDLDELGTSYARWREEAGSIVSRPDLPTGPVGSADERAFAVRSLLVHEWRKFLFSDPGLPAELLPPDWPGDAAACFFAEEARRLMPAAARHVDVCLADSRRDPRDPRDLPSALPALSDPPTAQHQDSTT